MNFLCDRCKQKYHVADEKVRGRAVTRFKCKKCEHVIELRMTGTDGLPSNALPDDGTAGSESPASVPPPASAPAARGAAPLPSRSATSVGMPAAPKVPTNLGAAPRPGASALPSLGNRPAAGTPAAALPSRPSNPPPGSVKRASLPPSPLLSGSPRPATSTGLPTAAARAASAPRPATSTGLPTATARAASPAASPLRTGLATKTAEPPRAPSAASALLNASETGWYAGVRDLPVGPLTRSELAAKIESGDITPDSLVWREGLDDWRPLRAVAELSDLVRVASQKMSDGLLGTMGRREPAPSAGKVVPIAQGRAATPAKDMGGFGNDDDEPTRMTALGDLIATAEERGLLSPSKSATTSSKPTGARSSVIPPAPAAAPPAATASASPSPAPARSSVAPPPPASATASAPPANNLPAAFAVPPAASSAAPAPATATKAAAIVGPNEPTFNIPPGSVGIGATAAPVAPAPTTPAATAAAAVVAKPQQQNDRKAIPVGIWILMAGVLMAGVAVGLFLRTPSTPPNTVAATTQPAPAPVVPPAAPTRQVGAEIQLPPEPANPPPVAAPAQPVATAPAQPAVAAADNTHRPHAATTASSGSSTTRTTSTGSSSGGSTLSAAQLAALNAQLGAQGSGVSQSTGPTNTQLRTTSQAQEPAGGGLTGEARAGQVINTFRRANVVDSCWTAAQRRNPAHPPESIRVAIDVSPTGRATSVRISGANDPDLTNCIQTRTRAQPYGAGGSVSTEVSFNLVPGQ